MNITDKKSIIPKTNFSVGRGQYRPEIIVVHISDGYKDAVIETFTNPLNQKSSHYFILRDGVIWQFVDEKNAAYGNGIINQPTAKKILEHKDTNPNLYSISIEHEEKNQDINDTQYGVSAKLIKEICDRWLIPIDREHIIGHHEIRADKVCPLPISVDKIVSLVLVLKQAETITPKVTEVINSPAYSVQQKVGLVGVWLTLLQIIKKIFQ